MFLDSKMKRAVKVVWWIASLIIIVSMVLLYTPIQFSEPVPVSEEPELLPPTDETPPEPTNEASFQLDA